MATQTLKEFIIKGFVLDDERLKQEEDEIEQQAIKKLIQKAKKK